MTKGIKNPAETDAPFNMGLVFLFRMNTLLEQKNAASIDNDLMKWYFVMREIYTDTIFYFSDEKREIFTGLFNDVKNLIWNKSNDSKTLQLNMELNAPLIREKLELVWIELNMLLFERGLIFPKMDYTPSMVKLRERYKLMAGLTD